MKSKHNRTAIALVLFTFGIVVVALVTAWMTDGHRLMDALGSLRVPFLGCALACSTISYLSIQLSFTALLHNTPYRVPFSRMSAITLISTTFNFVVSTAGLSSIAVRLYLFKKEKVPVSVMGPISVAQSMLTNVVLAGVCFTGLLFLETQDGFQKGAAQVLIWCALGLLLGLVSLTVLVFFHPGTRRRVLSSAMTLWHWIEKNIFKRHHAERLPVAFLHNVEKSIRLLHQGWKPLGFGLFWVSMDWFFTALTLGACFLAVGVHLSWGYLLVGFALAFLSTTLNILPGGLGVMEGLLTFTYAHFGIPAEKAIVAALLFRVVYFLIPLGLSCFLYLDTLKRLMRGEHEGVG